MPAGILKKKKNTAKKDHASRNYLFSTATQMTFGYILPRKFLLLFLQILTFKKMVSTCSEIGQEIISKGIGSYRLLGLLIPSSFSFR